MLNFCRSRSIRQVTCCDSYNSGVSALFSMMSASESLFGSFHYWSNGHGDTPGAAGDEPASSSESESDAPLAPTDDNDIQAVRSRIRDGFYQSDRIRSFIARCLAFDLVPYKPDDSVSSDDKGSSN